MNIIEKLKAEAMALRKARSTLGPTMQFHIAEIDKIGKAKNRQTSEDEAIQYLKKSVQKLKENQFADQEEIAVLERLLPQMATEDEVRAFLKAKYGFSGAAGDIPSKGEIMKAVREEFGALVDMKMVGGML